jgi:2-polyprenyl-3-methyl-5-hydroxy-6-metoxy-1,4-benzoquinol methylase
MDIANAHERLKGLWGQIDQQHNREIMRHIPPQSRVLDIGCGYGSLVNFLNKQGVNAVGIDYNAEHIAIGKQLFPEANIHVVNAESLETYTDGSFDVITLKDTLHHLVWENDTASAFANISRLLTPQGVLIVFDPNPMWILRLARRVIKHVDPEVSPQLAQQTLEKYGFKIVQQSYYEVFGLALSGGYVGVPLVPNIKIANQAVAGLNALISRGLEMVGLGRFVCWRYMMVAHKR